MRVQSVNVTIQMMQARIAAFEHARHHLKELASETRMQEAMRLHDAMQSLENGLRDALQGYKLALRDSRRGHGIPFPHGRISEK